MKRAISVVALVWFSLIFLYSAQAQTAAKVQVLSTEVVDELRSSITNETWTPADPSKNKGITVSLRLRSGFAYKADDFALAFKSSDIEQKVKVIGKNASPPDGWLFGEQGAKWVSFTSDEGPPTIDEELLFLVPIEVKEVTLMYKNKAVGKPIAIKQD